MPFKWCLKAYKIAEAGIVLMSASVYVCRIFETFGFAKWRHLVLAIIYFLQKNTRTLAYVQFLL